jgi:transposase
MVTEADVKYKFNKLSSLMDEKLKRQWAATEAKVIGHGGIALVSRATGIDKNTIKSGITEITKKGRKSKLSNNSSSRIRKEGGGRKSLLEKEPDLKNALEKLIDPITRGDPESPLLWTCKSLSKLAQELNNQGYEISLHSVGRMLNEMGYSLQSNKKSNEGSSHEDRDAQFNHINEKAKLFQKDNQPVISIDTKKKEIIGEYKNNGQEWQPKGSPVRVNDHDFPDKELGKAAPYGIYDIFNNTGWVNVGISADTAEFAVNSIKEWWKNAGSKFYSGATKLLINADCGGSNGNKNRLFKNCLQQLSNETQLEITVCHFPPGTSKWNKIEHRMFCHISNNWRGRPLTSLEVIVNTIKNTTTKTGLKIDVSLDKNSYKKGIKIDDEEMEKINIEKDEFHGEWNYTIKPNINLSGEVILL